MSEQCETVYLLKSTEVIQRAPFGGLVVDTKVPKASNSDYI